jgi:hypothetical protein
VSAYRKQRDVKEVSDSLTPLTTIKRDLIMADKNLSQHEQNLKLLEKSIREICQMQNEVYDTFYQTLNTFNTTRDMTMRLFVVADDLRTTRLAFEKAEGQ